MISWIKEESSWHYDTTTQYLLHHDSTLRLTFIGQVPLARYLAMTGSSNTATKLWQVGKVYRRDNPVMSKGRMREFTQAVCRVMLSTDWCSLTRQDFDMVGIWDSMIPEGEIVSLLCTILTRLDVGDFTIKVKANGMFELKWPETEIDK
jgi:histidyl-tRNA synthetase